MITYIDILALIMAYLVGSIPTAVWVGKYFYDVDVREYGSKNSGATNTFRVLGAAAGLPVLLLDVLKGFLAVKVATLLLIYPVGSDQFYNLELAMAMAVLSGHIFPVFAGFRGGKGVATMLGIVFALHAHAALVCIGIFILVLLVSRYVSLSSIVTGIAFPFVIMLIYHNSVVMVNMFAVIMAVVILLTHQKNIERLLRGEENKLNIDKFRK